MMNSTQQDARGWHRSRHGIIPLVLGAVLGLGGCSGGDEAGDAASADPEPARDLAALDSEHASTVHETTFANVYRVDLPPGAAIAPHDGGPRVIYSLNAYTLRFEADETSAERTFEAGEVHYHAGGVHAVENIGDQVASFMAFERTGNPLPAAAPTGQTLEATSIPKGATHEIPLENDRVTVHRIALDPGASLPSHYGDPRIVYSLSDYTLGFMDADGEAHTPKSFSEGEVHDHEAGRHAVENPGDQRAEYLVVAFKQ
jgi:quercetin dioxygenase-like cupin family protein